MNDGILAEQIANRLRRAILRGALPPGASIKERDNAAELGVSRTPMREAIRILAKEGLVELRPARSPIVALPDLTAVTEQAEVLIALEKLSAELACVHATEDELAELAELVDRIEQVVADTGYSGIHFVDEAAPPAALRRKSEDQHSEPSTQDSELRREMGTTTTRNPRLPFLS